eukprot:2422112-Prymnesium_polylepis.2
MACPRWYGPLRRRPRLRTLQLLGAKPPAAQHEEAPRAALCTCGRAGIPRLRAGGRALVGGGVSCTPRAAHVEAQGAQQPPIHRLALEMHHLDLAPRWRPLEGSHPI